MHSTSIVKVPAGYLWYTRIFAQNLSVSHLPSDCHLGKPGDPPCPPNSAPEVSRMIAALRSFIYLWWSLGSTVALIRKEIRPHRYS
jgi:hypothetical protein